MDANTEQSTNVQPEDVEDSKATTESISIESNQQRDNSPHKASRVLITIFGALAILTFLTAGLSAIWRFVILAEVGEFMFQTSHHHLDLNTCICRLRVMLI